jgi:Family of unknown function (DUF6776)
MKLVIRPHRPRQRVLMAVGWLILVTGAVAVAFHYGEWRSIVQSMGAASLKRGIMDDYVDVRQQNEQLVTEVAKLHRSVEIDQYARVDYQKTVSVLQSEIADLKLELAFYRDILSSTEAAKGPLVRGFKLRDYGGSGRFQYRLVLTNVNKDDKVANGYVDVEIRGHRSGAEQRLELADVAELDSGDLAFNFKHFRRIEGVLQLPDGFAPEEVHVVVYEDGRKKSSFNKIYNWAKLIN